MSRKKIEMVRIDRNDHIRFQKMNSPTIKKSEFRKNETGAGGKPSTWFPLERLVENTEIIQNEIKT